MNKNKLIIGVALVLLGILFLIDQTGIFSFWGINLWTLIWDLWPLIFVAIGIRLLTQGNTTGGIILTILGAIFLSSNLFDTNSWNLLWPLFIIAIGISLLFKDNSKHKDKSVKDGKVTGSSTDQDRIDQTAVFGGFEKKVTSTNFRGGEVNAIFGAAKLDLRDAKVSKDGAKLEVNGIFGGVEIFTPSNCRIITNGTGVFGAWNPIMDSSDVDTPVLEITGAAVFGEVKIR